MQRVRAGVVGVGSLGRHHARIYSQLENAELVGVSDQVREKAEGIAGKFGCRAFTDYRELLPHLDLVSIAVPTESHLEVALAAFQAGLHLLVEKPLADSVQACRAILEARDRAGRVLHVGHTERFNPVLSAVRGLVHRPRFFEAHRLGVFVPRSLDVDVVLDLMIHDLDLVLWLVGEPIAEIRAVGVPVLTPRVDIANVRIEFHGGCVANLTASRVSRDRVRKFRFFQPRDYASLDFHDRTVEMYSLEEGDQGPAIVERKIPVPEGEPLAREIEAFLEEASGGTSELSCRGEEGLQAVEAAAEILRRMQT